MIALTPGDLDGGHGGFRHRFFHPHFFFVQPWGFWPAVRPWWLWDGAPWPWPGRLVDTTAVVVHADGQFVAQAQVSSSALFAALEGLAHVPSMVTPTSPVRRVTVTVGGRWQVFDRQVPETALRDFVTALGMGPYGGAVYGPPERG